MTIRADDESQTAAITSAPSGRPGSATKATKRGGRWRRHVGQFGLVLLVLAGIGAVVYQQMFAPLAVRSQDVALGTVVNEVMGTGTLEAHVKVTISSKIGGRITEVLVDQGDQVKAGQVLVRLDDADFKRQVETEQANITAKQAAIDRLQAERKRAEATLELARHDFDRVNRLVQRNVSSLEELDKYIEGVKIAEADLSRAEAGLVEGRKQLIAAEKAHEFQRARLADTVVMAPFDGLIVRRDRDPGDVVVPGTSVLALVSTREIWASTWVDETEMARVHPGQSARVVFRSEPDRNYRGTVVRLGREADRETREFLVDVNPDNLPSQWAVGQRVEVYIETARRSDVVTLPVRFLVERGEQSGTFVAVAGQSRWRPLTLGLRGQEAIEVVAGLRAGEQILRPADPGGRSLTDGRRVAAP